MLTIKQLINNKIRIIGEFETIDQVYDHFKSVYGAYRLHEKFSHNINEWYLTNFIYDNYKVYCLVVENDQGIRYSRETIKGLFDKIYKAAKKERWRQFPWFSGRNRHYRGSYRRIRTTNERRAAATVLIEEGEPEFRNRRNFTNLPNTWDDILHQDTRNRNWKRFRKTQYKIKE